MISGNSPTGFAELSRAFNPHSVLQKWGYTTIVCSAGICVDKKPLSGEGRKGQRHLGYLSKLASAYKH